MRKQLMTIHKASFTKKEIVERLIKFYLLWITIGIVSMGISVITQPESFSWSNFLTKVISWLIFGFVIVLIFDFALTSYHKVVQLSLIEDINQYVLELKFKSTCTNIRVKDIYRLQIQSKFTKNTDKIFIKYRNDKGPKSISIIINHENLKEIEMIKRFIK